MNAHGLNTKFISIDISPLWGEEKSLETYLKRGGRNLKYETLYSHCEAISPLWGEENP